MNRRTFLLASAAPFAARDACAQEARKPLVGWLYTGGPEDSRREMPRFVEALRAQGFVDGRDIVIDHRWAHGDFSLLPGMARDLVADRKSTRLNSSH